ncbi:hypothetical protein CAPTEDRAFT_167143 [Capitella teleta]|uniref:Neurotransmitter-gated ion-channel ligand-binding domain-containing protein n=1 Tax=Capitella teleta TaxID=283909 RepID=R7U8Z7_CAPTE|nr:hypothetical protein CAPTEDRAFT_167143 [Capitella teleta]|eukprot:ELT99605.1 hypothetical protein CAPTEDRAFT_167143 [Capitella teleta]
MEVTWLIIAVATLAIVTHGNHDAKRLYDDLLNKNNYNKLVRPVSNYSQPVKLKFGLKFAQLNEVDEKNEIMTTNMWVKQIWEDVFLQWNREEYGGVDRIYVPATSIWLPDVMLNNNGDGDYVITIMTKAMLTYTGVIEWNPPAIFKSHCDINVQYFPFDIQVCKLQFLPWSHDGYKVDMVHIWRDKYATDKTNYSNNPFIPMGIDMKQFVPSQEWDVLAVTAQKNIRYYPCCKEPFPDITFQVTIRRKTLFYSINIIVPCVCINLLTLTGFYVPCDCGEKISICITILLSISMFQLLLFDLVPGTSVSVPLLGQYILFTLFVTTGSVVCSVIVLNVNYRGSLVGTMPPRLKSIFVDNLARILCMPQPTAEEQEQEMEDQIDWSLAHSDLSSYVNPYKKRFRQRQSVIQETMMHLRNGGDSKEGLLRGYKPSQSFIGFDKPNMYENTVCEKCARMGANRHLPNVQKAFEGVGYIAKHHQENDDSSKIKDDWVYMAQVVDRLLLWIYVSLSFLCTMTLLLNAPALFDTRPGLEPRKPKDLMHF